MRFEGNTFVVIGYSNGILNSNSQVNGLKKKNLDHFNRYRKTFRTIQHTFKILKTLSKIRIKKDFVNLMKDTYNL